MKSAWTLIRLNDFARRMNFLVQRDQNAFAARVRRERQANRVEHIAIAVIADFIVLALPLTPETEDLFGTERLARVKPGAWLINIARGRLVNEQALLRALHDGPLGGAVLDTFREEPLPPESPLWGVPNLIVTPHTSWSSGRVLDRSVELFCDNLRRYSAGDALLNVVDWDKGY